MAAGRRWLQTGGVGAATCLLAGALLCGCSLPTAEAVEVQPAVPAGVGLPGPQSSGPPFPSMPRLSTPSAAEPLPEAAAEAKAAGIGWAGLMPDTGERNPMPESSGADQPGGEQPAEATTMLIGYTTLGYPIEAYVYGSGPRRVAFVGAIHGGYEWNTTLLAYLAIDYFAAHPESIPEAVTLYIVPSANPDGQVLVTGRAGRFTLEDVAAESRPGRFNGNGVDLNRNWACAWEPTGLWGTTEVSAGSAPMSEAETVALARFLAEPPMAGVIFWHSALNSIYAGGCDGPFAASEALAVAYADAAGYPFERAFTNYRVTGDATDWLSLQGVPAITVELSTHESLDWEQNLAGMLAALDHLAAQEPATQE